MNAQLISVQLIKPDHDFATLASSIDTAAWDDLNEIDQGDYTATSLSNFVRQPRTFLVTAHVGEEFVGLASGSVMLHPHKTGQWLYVDELDVVVSYRRQGVGTAIMDFLDNYARELGCYELALGADTPNEGANGLYKSRNPDEIEPANWYCYQLKKD